MMIQKVIASLIAHDVRKGRFWRSFLLSLGAAWLGAFATVAPARAGITPLTLANAGFELQNPFDQSAGCGSLTPCYNFTIVDWNQFGTSGTFAPGGCGPSVSCAPAAYQGNNEAFLAGGYITQDLGMLSRGTTYSISTMVASRAALSPSLYRLGVGTGGTAAAPTWTAFDQISGTASYNWSLATIVFTPTSTADWYVFVANDGASGGGSSQLEVDATPEPGFYGLLSLGFIGLATLASRRKNA